VPHMKQFMDADHRQVQAPLQQHMLCWRLDVVLADIWLFSCQLPTLPSNTTHPKGTRWTCTAQSESSAMPPGSGLLCTPLPPPNPVHKQGWCTWHLSPACLPGCLL
jgi:hypothetical protein